MADDSNNFRMVNCWVRAIKRGRSCPKSKKVQ